MIDPLLLTCTRVTTFSGNTLLTNATGFFFERNHRLFLVTSRHVMADEKTSHFPNRIEAELHSNPENLAESMQVSIPLYNGTETLWRQLEDRSGLTDIGVIEMRQEDLPAKALLRSFTPEHLPKPGTNVQIGARLLIVGFPLGFHDNLHHAPVVRQAALSSAWNLRFQGQGVFLTDARTHRGSSGAPVVTHTRPDGRIPHSLPYLLLGVHSARFDIGSRDTSQDEALGLNCAWYADALMELTN